MESCTCGKMRGELGEVGKIVVPKIATNSQQLEEERGISCLLQSSEALIFPLQLPELQVIRFLLFGVLCHCYSRKWVLHFIILMLAFVNKFTISSVA